MAKRKSVRWLDFERLATRIVADLLPHADVKHDDRIVGVDSHAHRQIDVSARWNDGDTDRLLIVQAKDLGRPADVGVIDKFYGEWADVPADRALLVCSSGFSKAAVSSARNRGIELYNLHDATSVDWSRKLTIPFLWMDYMPCVMPSVNACFDAGDSILHHPKYGPFTLSPDGGRRVLTIMDSFAEAWNRGDLPRSLNAVHNVTSSQALQLSLRVTDVNGETCWRPVEEFHLQYVVRRRAWLGHYEPTNCRGLIDYLNDRQFTPTFLDRSDLPTSRDEAWSEVDEPDQVALRTSGTIITSECFEIVAKDGVFHGYVADYLGPSLG